MKHLILISALLFSFNGWAEWQTHSIDQCSFKVKFPGTPEVRQIYTPGLASPLEQLGYEGKGFYLRAECFPSSLGSLNQSEIRSIMFNYASSNGLQNVELSWVTTQIGPAMQLRGYKEVAGTPVTSLIRMHQGRTSLLILFVIGESRTFPQKETDDFFIAINGQSYEIN